MMTTMESCVRSLRHRMRRLALDPRFHRGAKYGAYTAAGFCLSAASLSGHPQPLVLGMLCALDGLPALLAAVGGAAGYWVFWGSAGMQSILWTVLGCAVAVFLGSSRLRQENPALMCAIGALITAFSGVLFQQLFLDDTSVPVYLLRVLLAPGAALTFRMAMERRDPIARWFVVFFGVLAAAQIPFWPGLSLGPLAAAFLSGSAPFPALALAGLALDLSRISRVPMTAALCLCFFLRFLPGRVKWVRITGPAAVTALIMALCGTWDLKLLPGLLLGGALSLLRQEEQPLSHRRGETGLAQVRLEMAAGVLGQTQQLLLEVEAAPVDEGAVLARCAERACGNCPCRKGCKDRDQVLTLPTQLLHRPLLDTRDLPFLCKKPARLLLELHRCQEQLRTIRADRARLKEYRAAMIQQYYFLSSYLRDLSDQLPQRSVGLEALYEPKIYACTAGKEPDNGDKCLSFAGVQCRYYVLLCDGMGTGLGASHAGKHAASMLKQMLCAGFPAEHALRSLNSLCTLRMQAGIVTFDLLELRLDTGRGCLYKWGAAPSYLLGNGGAEKIGTAGPPPGLSVEEGRETVERLSLRRGETLVMVSDGVDGEGVLRCLVSAPAFAPGEMAEKLLEQCAREENDDATVVTVRLSPAP